jgi:L-aspartate oxidase
MAQELLTAPAVVVGGGVAGLATALALDGCLVVADEPVGGGSSRHAQGGIATALGPDDSVASHAADTLRVAAGLGDEAIAGLVAAAAPGRIAWLRSAGVEFDLGPAGEPRLGREAGHARHRIVHAGGDRTGEFLMRALRCAARGRADIRLLEGYALIDLISDGARAAGVLLAAPDGSRLAVLAPNVVLATGGIGACFEHSTNPATSRGAGLAAAARRGVRLADLEFVQFHPTALAARSDPLPLLTEALRGAGALLIDEAGERFMPSVHPDAELAPRDVVARAVAARRAGGREVLLDATAIRRIATRFPGACAIARAAGFDAARQPLPVTAAAHFHMGGIATDDAGATSLPGLWACGEVACTGLHGGNRLASNSLLEGLVFGERVARSIRAAGLSAPRGPLDVPHRPLPDVADPARIATLRRLIGRSLGPMREGSDMAQALARLAAWRPASREEADLASIARLLLAAASGRRESRGAHWRADHPAPVAGLARRSFLQPAPAPVATLGAARRRVA